MRLCGIALGLALCLFGIFCCMAPAPENLEIRHAIPAKGDSTGESTRMNNTLPDLSAQDEFWKPTAQIPRNIRIAMKDTDFIVLVNQSVQRAALMQKQTAQHGDNLVLIEETPCSTGRDYGRPGDAPTPNTLDENGNIGYTTILYRETNYNSKKFGVPMPYAMNLDIRDQNNVNAGVFIHKGIVRKSEAASHGCIRLPGDVAPRWFGLLRVGDKVVIIGKVQDRKQIQGMIDLDRYVTWIGGKAYFKAELPDATPEEKEIFLKELFYTNQLVYDRADQNGNLLYDKNRILFRFESIMQKGRGMSVALFEEIYQHAGPDGRPIRIKLESNFVPGQGSVGIPLNTNREFLKPGENGQAQRIPGYKGQ